MDEDITLWKEDLEEESAFGEGREEEEVCKGAPEDEQEEESFEMSRMGRYLATYETH